MALDQLVKNETIEPIITPIMRAGGLTVYEVYREKLDRLVRESKLVKKYASSFYDYDLHVVKRLQNDCKLLLFGVNEFEENNRMIFIGRELEIDKDFMNKRLSGNHVQFIVKDLKHLTCVIFAYATYQLILSNLKFYKVLQRIPTAASSILEGFNNTTLEKVEAYFNERLASYLRNER